MTESLDRFDRAAAVADSVFTAVRPEQHTDPTPCTQWTVRQVMNHVVGGNRAFLAMQTGGGPVDRAADFLGDDPAQSFRASVQALRDAFAADGALEKVVPTPFGEQPGQMLVRMRVNEMMIHAWDLARATGQPTDFEPALAEECATELRQMRANGRGAGMFDDEQAAPDGATPADRLAAVAGRPLA